MLLSLLSSIGKRDARSRLFARPWQRCFMACLLARRHLPPGERASAYGVVVHLEERQGEGPVSMGMTGRSMSNIKTQAAVLGPTPGMLRE